MAKCTWMVFYIFITIIILLFFLRILPNDYIESNPNKYTLGKDGVEIFKKVIDNNTINDLKKKCKSKNYRDTKTQLMENKSIQKIIQNIGEDYKYQDYIWIIQKSAVHTCHRDNNGDFFNQNQKHPSYTMLIYLENMEKCLGVIPNSHLSKSANNINLWSDPVVNLPCQSGDIIIFNANLIHVGCINKRDDNLRIQMKITHKDDLETLKYYQNFNKVLNKDNQLPVEVRRVQRQFSCMLPILSNATQGENIRTARGSDNGVDVGFFQRMFSYLFYGNKDFYDLPNAF